MDPREPRDPVSAIKDLIDDVGCSVLNDGESELEYGPKMDLALDELREIRELLVDQRHHFASVVRENAGPIWVVHHATISLRQLDAILAKMDFR